MKKHVPPSIAEQVSQACAVLHKHLPGSIVAIHLFGSAVDAGLKPLSDVDLLATVAHPPSAAVRHALMRELLAVSAPPGTSASLRALEVTVLARGEVVPWRYPLDDTHRKVLQKARAAYLGLEADALARHPEDVAAFIAHARRTIERLCAGQSAEHAS